MTRATWLALLIVGAAWAQTMDSSLSYCYNPQWTNIPATGVQFFQYFQSSPPPFVGTFFQPSFVPSAFSNGAFPFGNSVSCPGLAAPATNWPLGTDANPSHLLVRFNVFVPGIFVGSTLTITVDNDLVGAWVNGFPVGTPQTRDTCGPVSTPITITIPSSYLFPGSNLIALHVQDRGVESFLDASVKVDLCADQCTAAAAQCRFQFKGFEGLVPIFLLGNTPDGPGFTTQVVSKNPTLTINDMNANNNPQFINTVTGVRTNVNVFGLTTFQFKPFNQPVPRIGFETFQGNTRAQANNRCVIINFTNWRSTDATGQITNVNINSPADCPNGDCCVVFRTTNPA